MTEPGDIEFEVTYEKILHEDIRNFLMNASRPFSPPADPFFPITREPGCWTGMLLAIPRLIRRAG